MGCVFLFDRCEKPSVNCIELFLVSDIAVFVLKRDVKLQLSNSNSLIELFQFLLTILFLELCHVIPVFIS